MWVINFMFFVLGFTLLTFVEEDNVVQWFYQWSNYYQYLPTIFGV